MRYFYLVSLILLLGGCNLFQKEAVPVSAPEVLTAKALLFYL